MGLKIATTGKNRQKWPTKANNKIRENRPKVVKTGKKGQKRAKTAVKWKKITQMGKTDDKW